MKDTWMKNQEEIMEHITNSSMRKEYEDLEQEKYLAEVLKKRRKRAEKTRLMVERIKGMAAALLWND